MELKTILESLLFSSQKPVSAKDLRKVLVNTANELKDDEQAQEFKGIRTNQVTKELEELAKEYEERRGSFRLVQIADAWQFASEPEFAPWIRTLVGEKQRPARLSAPALETMAIIAYRQPITRSEIEQIRGVSVDGTMQKLLERGLVESTGKADVVGRPSLYGTTPLFLEYFGIASLDDLPDADELRRIPVERPETLATAEPGLATAPPEQLTLDDVGGAKENTASELAVDSSGGDEEEEFEDDDDDVEDLDDEEEDLEPRIVAGPLSDEEEEFEEEDDEFEDEGEEEEIAR
tara:strand:+ start:1478 stop:2353 length:876 start_codon:yes stop_codon:yes gene_type:complete